MTKGLRLKQIQRLMIAWKDYGIDAVLMSNIWYYLSQRIGD